MNSRLFRRGAPRSLRHSRGLSLIEVLVAVLVLGLGLLGLAMLQATNLKLAQSANQRTIATNLANDLLDDIRSNRLLAAKYATVYKANTVPPNTNCAQLGEVTPDDRIRMFTCRLRDSLGDSALANVKVTANDALKRFDITIDIEWGDATRWQADALATSFHTESTL